MKRAAGNGAFSATLAGIVAGVPAEIKSKFGKGSGDQDGMCPLFSFLLE